LPFLIVADDLKAERLVPLLPEYTATGTLIHAVYPAGRHMPTAVRTFLDFLVK
jgi:DNA-binding transcriptional LysR family regulator